MLDMEADFFVPGHGPVTDKKGVASIKSYWTTMKVEARKRFDAGMSVEESISDIDLYFIWDTVLKDLPPLVADLEKIIPVEE
jgi:hypothetical protein